MLCYTQKDLQSALQRIFKIDRVALIQMPVTGKDYRIVVLDKRIISAYERVPLHVCGDGTSSIKKLLKIFYVLYHL